MRVPLILSAVGLLVLSVPVKTALTQGGIESRRVTIRPGSSATEVQGTLKGDQTIDDRLRAGASQRLTVDLKASHP